MLLAGCGDNAPAIFQDQHPWFTQWVNNPVCQPPCWENITPGETTMKDALSIISNLSNIKITYRTSAAIDWEFSKSDTGAILSDDEGKVLSVILHSNTGNITRLNKVIDKYGIPSFIQPYDCREDKCATTAAFPNIGLNIDLFLQNNGGLTDLAIDVNSSAAVYTILFFPPGVENYYKLPIPQNYQAIKWKGYGQYP